MKGFPANPLLDPNLDIGRKAIGPVERSGRDVHMAGPLRPPVSDRASAIPTEDPVDTPRTFIIGWLPREPFEVLAFEHRPGDIGAAARPPAVAAVAESGRDRLPRYSGRGPTPPAPPPGAPAPTPP